jgi:type IV pilus assembly protein PilY1
MSGWNSLSTAKYASNSPSPGVLGQSNLQQQTAALGASGDIDMTSPQPVCWAGRTTCGSGNNKYGWYLNLPGTNEQIIYSPSLVAQAFTVNSIVPAVNSPTSCTNQSDTGFTYVISALTGTAFNQVFLPPSQQGNSAVNHNPAYTDTTAIAMQTNATGSSFVTGNSTGTNYLVYETNQVETGNGANGNNIQGGTLGLNLPPNTTGHRLSWIELR